MKPDYSIKRMVPFRETSRSLIYYAFDTGHSKYVVKSLREPLPSSDQVARFQHEYKICAECQNDTIVKVLDFRKVEGLFSIVMEDIGGESLDIHIAQQRNNNDRQWTKEDFLHLAILIAKGLQHIHSRGVLHKDINPSNIIFNRETKEVKIIDFGISSYEKSQIKKESDNALEGSLLYISPEQTGRMNRVVDRRTDLYAFGVTLYELLSGDVPFHANDALGIIHQQMTREVNPLSLEQTFGISKLNSIILKLLRKDPEDRYQSAEGILFDLQSIAEKNFAERQANFQLATMDVSERLRLPSKIYGREEELTKLEQSYQKLQQDKKHLVVISGEPGIGKTTLMDELRKWVHLNRGSFISGKFDLLQRSRPYSALIDALSNLAESLMALSSSKLDALRYRLKINLGDNIELILQLIPQFRLIYPTLGHAHPVNFDKEKPRMFMAIQSLFRSLCSTDDPLVLFLDDLQWADLQTFELLESLLKRDAIDGLLIAISYRSNEVDPQHQINILLEEVHPVIPITMIKVGPLQFDALCELTAHTLQKTPEHVADLTTAINIKTNGNPFYYLQLFQSLCDSKKIKFDRVKRSWTYSIDEIRSLEVTENVLTFLMDKFRNLPENVLSILQLGSCLGHSFALQEIAAVAGIEIKDSLKALQQSVLLGILIGKGVHNAYLELENPGTEDYNPLDLDIKYQFQHDRLRAASLESMSDRERQRFHYQIGKRLLERMPWDEAAVDTDLARRLVEQWEKIDIATLGNDEKQILASASRHIGLQFFASSSYSVAGRNLERSQRIWEELGVKPDFEFEKKLAQSYMFQKKFVEFMDYFDKIMQQPLLKEERIQFQYLKLSYFYLRDKRLEAHQFSIEILSEYGIRFRRSLSLFYILNEVRNLERNLKNLDIDEWVRLNLNSLDEKENTIRDYVRKIFYDCSQHAYALGDRQFFTWGLIKNINLAFTQGLDATMSACLNPAATVLFMLGKIDTGRTLVRLGEVLAKNMRDKRYIVYYYLFFGGYICHCFEDWRKARPYLVKAIRAGIDYGETVFFPITLHFMMRQYFESDLDATIDAFKKYWDLVKTSNTEGGIQAVKAFYDTIEIIVDEKSAFGFLGDDPRMIPIDPKRLPRSHIAQFDSLRFTMGIGMILLSELILSTIFNQEAHFPLKDCRRAMKLVLANNTVTFKADTLLYGMRVLIKKHASLKWWQKIYNYLIFFRIRRYLKWASGVNHTNFSAHYHLVEALWFGFRKNIGKTITHFTKARDSAEENEIGRLFSQSSEWASEFYFSLGNRDLGIFYLNKAVAFYSTWGAKAKIKHLELTHKYYAKLVRNTQTVSNTLTHGTTSGTIEGVGSDTWINYGTVLKATQLLSQSLSREQLLTHMMKLIVENANASRGIFLVYENTEQGHGLKEAQFDIDDNEVRIFQRDQIDFREVPLAIINYVFHSRKKIVVHDVNENNPYEHDRYFGSASPRSIFCSPILRNNQLLGLIYLEHKSLARVFRESQEAMLDHLLVQAAISLENIQFYSGLEKKVKERTEQLEKTHAQMVDLAHKAGMADIASGVLHSVGNLIPGVQVELSKAYSKNQSPEVLKYLKAAEGKLMQMGSILHHHEEIAHSPGLVEEVDIGIVIAQALQAVADKFPSQNFDVSYENQITHKVNIQKFKVSFILSQIVMYAYEVSNGANGKPRISIRVNEDATQNLVITIADNGPGIPDDAKSTIFSAGYKLRKGSIGMGFHEAYNFARSMRGQIELLSTGTDGSVFRLLLPLRDPTIQFL